MITSGIDGGCPLIVGGCPLTDNVELVSVDRADELEVDDCRIVGADRLVECLGLGEGTFMAEVGLEDPGVLAGERELAETPFTVGLGAKLSFLEWFLARSAYESGAGLVDDDCGWATIYRNWGNQIIRTKDSRSMVTAHQEPLRKVR